MLSLIASWACVSCQTSILFPFYSTGNLDLGKAMTCPYSQSWWLQTRIHTSSAWFSYSPLCFHHRLGEKDQFLVSRIVISSQGTGPISLTAPHPLLPGLLFCRNPRKGEAWFYQRGQGLLRFCQNSTIHYPQNIILTSPSYRFSHYIFSAKENGPAIQIPSYGSWLYYKPWDVHLLSIGLTFRDRDWRK